MHADRHARRPPGYDNGPTHEHGSEVLDGAAGGAPDKAVDDLIWGLDNIELTTVGIDIGSATSSVMFARLTLRRRSRSMSSRFEVIDRRVLYRSSIMLTPYLGEKQIDAVGVRRLVDESYVASGLDETQVDTGVVLLTGMALLRDNAQAIGELLADEGGKLVCAAAGHNLEALLAAHGAGAVARSAARGSRVLSLDVGGGTTKLTMIDHGAVIATAATVGGGRLLAWDDDRRLIRVERVVTPIAASLGITPRLGELITPEQTGRIAAELAARVYRAIDGVPGEGELLAGGLPPNARPDLVLMSGGVSQHLLAGGPDQAQQPINDLGRELADALLRGMNDRGTPIEVASSPITATVVGASQFSAQVSGNTVLVADDEALPARNLPVISVDLRGRAGLDARQIRMAADASRQRLSLEGNDQTVAYAIRWNSPPAYANLRALADGIVADHRLRFPQGGCLVVCVDSDIAASLGAIIIEELQFDGSLIALDGLELAELDFLDIGEVIMPANAVPVLVKSLLFAGGASHHEL